MSNPSLAKSAVRVSTRAAIVLVLGVGAASFAALGAFLMIRPDLMVVERVEFVGNDRASVAELRHLVDIRNGTTVWDVDLVAAERGAVRHPWVRSVAARRRLPYDVVVEVEEYEPVALLARGGLYYVDRSGVVFHQARSDYLDLPVITGVDDALERAHPDLPRIVVRDAIWLLDELDVRGLVGAGRVSEIAFYKNRGFTFYLVSGARLRFGLEDLERQTDRLAALLVEGVDPGLPVLVDLAPASVAIVRPVGEQHSHRRTP